VARRSAGARASASSSPFWTAMATLEVLGTPRRAGRRDGDRGGPVLLLKPWRTSCRAGREVVTFGMLKGGRWAGRRDCSEVTGAENERELRNASSNSAAGDRVDPRRDDRPGCRLHLCPLLGRSVGNP